MALVLDVGTAAGLVALGWLGVCLLATGAGLVGAWRLVRRPGWRPDLGEATVLAGLVYLSVGGAWLVISRFGWRPLDLSTDIVRLTAVHFHYAGFALPLLGALALRSMAGAAEVAGLAGVAERRAAAARSTLAVGCVTSVVGPPVVALGFTSGAAVPQVGGAVVMTVAAWAVAAGTLWSVRPAWSARGWPAVGGTLLGVSSASPVVAMALAVQWAIGQHTAVRALSVDDMAATHGLLNGVGFVMAGLAGRTVASRGGSGPSRAGSAPKRSDAPRGRA